MLETSLSFPLSNAELEAGLPPLPLPPLPQPPLPLPPLLLLLLLLAELLALEPGLLPPPPPPPTPIEVASSFTCLKEIGQNVITAYPTNIVSSHLADF